MLTARMACTNPVYDRDSGLDHDYIVASSYAGLTMRARMKVITACNPIFLIHRRVLAGLLHHPLHHWGLCIWPPHLKLQRDVGGRDPRQPGDGGRHGTLPRRSAQVAPSPYHYVAPGALPIPHPPFCLLSVACLALSIFFSPAAGFLFLEPPTSQRLCPPV